MIILKQCERINLVADEKDIENGQKRILIQFNGRLYDDTFQCINKDGAKPLYAHLRNEYEDNVVEALEKFKEVESQYSKAGKTTLKTETPTSGIGAELEKMFCEVLAKQSVDQVIEMAKPLLEKHIIDTFGVLPEKHEVVTPIGKHEFEGVTHEKFDTVLNLINADIPVFLTGAAGTGKNVICKQVAEGMGLDFYFTNAVTQEYQLKGFIDANGTFHETQFYKAFTNGGLFFLDEMDASIPETLIILNAAIANRYFDFPNGKVEANPNFRVIAAGNTVGTGADIEYTGRFQLDASSLDRFALVQIDYSPKIEESVTENNKDLCLFARRFREVTNKVGIRCLCSYRSIERIAKLEDVFDLPEVIRMSLTKGIGKDDLKIIVKGFSDMKFYNKYVEALQKLSAQ